MFANQNLPNSEYPCWLTEYNIKFILSKNHVILRGYHVFIVILLNLMNETIATCINSEHVR